MVIPSVAEDLRPLHILVVDDDPLLRAFLADDLRDEGMTVIEASNADEALTYCQSNAPVDLVFTDVQMPGSMDGIGLAHRLSKTEPGIPVIVTSGAVPVDSLVPEIPFIAKPYAVKDARTLIFLDPEFGATGHRMTSLLLVEADILVRAALAAYLRECGFRVIEATSIAEARMFLADVNASIDLVLAEIGGTDEDGFALASWIRKERPAIDVILAGTLETATKKAGDLCESEPSVTKPYDHQLVLDRIRRAVAGREPGRK